MLCFECNSVECNSIEKNERIMYKNIILLLSFCLKCGGNTKSISPLVSKIKNGGAIILSKSAICNAKKSKFIKEQEAKGLLSNLCIRTPLSKIPLLGDILF